MKPKNKMHYEIVSLGAKLPKISDAQVRWAYKKNFNFYVWKTKHKAICFECGHEWPAESNLLINILTLVCPNCGRELKMVDSHAWRKTELDYLQIMTTIGDYQVIRVIQLYHWMVKSIEAHYSWHELYQHWIHKDGKLNIMSTGFNSMGYYNQGAGWSWCGPMELRNNQNDRYFINDIPIYPRRKILPNIIRNGWTGEFFTYNPGWFFYQLLSVPRFETFLKTKQYSLLKEFNHSDHLIGEFWTQIKICIRNNYHIQDASIWFDYLELLKHFHKNIYDPAVLCPEDVNLAHDVLVAKKQAIDDRNEAVEQERRDRDNLAFRKAKKRMMHLLFTDGEITIVPLKNVTDFKIEEKTLGHCVYSSAYHKKDNSLIMSARKGDERLETIEISLRDFSIRQCRGYENKDSAYHKVILNLLNSNIDEIKKASKEGKPIKTKVSA